MTALISTAYEVCNFTYYVKGKTHQVRWRDATRLVLQSTVSDSVSVGAFHSLLLANQSMDLSWLKVICSLLLLDGL